MPLKEPPDKDRPDNAISAAIRHDENLGRTLETWNTCPNCGAKWKDPIRTEGLLHRTRLCGSCRGE